MHTLDIKIPYGKKTINNFYILTSSAGHGLRRILRRARRRHATSAVSPWPAPAVSAAGQ